MTATNVEPPAETAVPLEGQRRIPPRPSILLFVGDDRASQQLARLCRATMDDGVQEVDAWGNHSLVTDHLIRSLPTIVVLDGERERTRLTGPATRRRTDRFLREFRSP